MPRRLPDFWGRGAERRKFGAAKHVGGLCEHVGGFSFGAVRRRYGRLSRVYEFEVGKAGCLSWVRPNGTCVFGLYPQLLYCLGRNHHDIKTQEDSKKPSMPKTLHKAIR